MALGRKKADEPQVQTVSWRDVLEFEITEALWRRKNRRRRVQRGRLAVRVPMPDGDSDRVPLVPCAYFHPKVASSIAASRAYVDPDAEQLLLSMEKSTQNNGEKHYLVRDAAGGEVGSIRRIPAPTMLHRHRWILTQPGRPEIVARTQRRLHTRGMLVDIVANLAGVDEGGEPLPIRTLEWHAGGEHVMTSRAFDAVTMHAGWIDRRLAIAYAMLLDR